MENWVKDLTYILMPSRHPVKGYEEQYQMAYKTWRDAWEKFRSEIGIEEKLLSDGIRVTDEIGALFYKGECVGLHCFTYGSLEDGMLKDLSYFKGWSDVAYAKLKKYSENGLICSQFTVDPKFTGKDQIVRWKEINFLYIFMRYQNSIADIMCGHLNMTRKVQDAAGQSFGATILDPYVPFDYYGVELASQLVAYEKNNLAKIQSEKGIIELCNSLWGNVIHLSDFPIVQNIHSLKKTA